jgi:hypothetical protein
MEKEMARAMGEAVSDLEEEQAPKEGHKSGPKKAGKKRKADVEVPIPKKRVKASKDENSALELAEPGTGRQEEQNGSKPIPKPKPMLLNVSFPRRILKLKFSCSSIFMHTKYIAAVGCVSLSSYTN